MFNRVRNRFNWRSGRARMAVAAMLCAAGMAVGVGVVTTRAQLVAPNPTPNTETTSCDVSAACTITIPTTPPMVVPCWGSAGGVAATAGNLQVSGNCGYIYVNIAGQLTQLWCPEAQVVGTCQVALAPARANVGMAESGAS